MIEDWPLTNCTAFAGIRREKPYNTGMASWIVHLRLAEGLLRLLPDLEPGPFAVGSIAPDSGIPDESWEKFEPPPEVTHFGHFGGARRELADLEFYRRHLLPWRGEQDPGPVSFRLGYFCHLIADNLWSEKIGRPTADRFAVQFAADKDFIWEVKKDWYGLDFIHVRDHPESLFWRVFLTARPETGGLDFLPLEAVRQRVEYIQGYYQRTDTDVQKAYNRPYVYLSAAEMDGFVEESIGRLDRIVEYLWIEGAPAQGPSSALDLVL